MTGIKLTDGAKVISFTAVDPAADAVVFTVAGSRGTLDDSVQTTVKLTPSTSIRARAGPPEACAASGS
ncbi:hypothetical protein SHKM778_23460 [Streptomyces sp. KM77-8]|uniref:Uncharacterized protein n=1 Tax=Streptomyces haneummycinicus TaxID=3074435 RepID=A0AAT9HF53_9ACTN